MNFTSLDDITERNPLVFYDYELPYTDLILEMYNNPDIKPENYDLENHIILNLIGQYYHFICINYEEAKKYYLLAIAKDNKDSMFSLANYYKVVEKNYEEMIKYYLLIIEKNTDDAKHAMNDLANYYYYQDDYEEMIKYHLMAIEKGSICSMKSLGHYYYQIKSYEEMIKYYTMAFDVGDIESIDYLANYYRQIKDYKKMEKYCLILIEHNNLSALNILNIYYENDLTFYHILSNLENKSDIVIEKINTLLKCPIVSEYIEKVNTTKDNIHECLICCNNLQHITFNCGHEICINCYCLVNKCYYRCS